MTPEVKKVELPESTPRHLCASRDRQEPSTTIFLWTSFPGGVHDVTSSFLRARRDVVFSMRGQICGESLPEGAVSVALVMPVT